MTTLVLPTRITSNRVEQMKMGTSPSAIRSIPNLLGTYPLECLANTDSPRLIQASWLGK